MTTSDQVGEIAAALAAAQGRMKNATLNKVNPHFKSKFADLASVRDAVVPALAGQGISVSQTMVPFDGRVCLATRLLHSSGQWIESLMPLPDAADMQKLGSALTYARRYSLSAICGIAADEDDDGNEAASATLTSVAATSKPAAADMPGWGDFVTDMTAKADEGMAALTRAFNEARAEYRKELAASVKWRLLQAHAKKVDEARTAKRETVTR